MIKSPNPKGIKWAPHLYVPSWFLTSQNYPACYPKNTYMKRGKRS